MVINDLLRYVQGRTPCLELVVTRDPARSSATFNMGTVPVEN